MKAYLSIFWATPFLPCCPRHMQKVSWDLPVLYALKKIYIYCLQKLRVIYISCVVLLEIRDVFRVWRPGKE